MHELILAPTNATPGQYYSYLVRIWRPTRSVDWRIMVEAIGRGERYIFTDLEDMFAFLEWEVWSPPTDVQASHFDQ